MILKLLAISEDSTFDHFYLLLVAIIACIDLRDMSFIKNALALDYLFHQYILPTICLELLDLELTLDG